jgi:hypothetical protein
VYTNKPCGIPDGGVAVVHGGQDMTFLKCINPGEEADVMTSPYPLPSSTGAERTVALQCCEKGVDGTDGCRRYIDRSAGMTQDNCVGGKAIEDGITEFTYQEAVDECKKRGEEASPKLELELCAQSCAGQGCQYNTQPVITNIPCGAF